MDQLPQTIRLVTKPDASLQFHLIPASSPHGPLESTLLVFLNGLVLPQVGWKEAIAALVAKRRDANRSLPAILTYDRYGQGHSDHDPHDPPDAGETGYGHDARTVIDDLHQLLTQICDDYLGTSLARTALVLVCNSIGCPLARLYAASHGCDRVAGFLFLDSMMANTDFVSLFPDPDSQHFDPSKDLPEGVEIDDLRHARDKYQEFFHPTVANKERFDRRNLRQLLPHAESPEIKGLDGKGPHLTVVGHDPDEFAEQCKTGMLQIPAAVTNAYIKPAWQAYNEGLTHISPDVSRVNGPLIAPGCGHFIQKDGPKYTAELIGDLLDRIEKARVLKPSAC